MITFIPKDKEGNARAGVRAGCQALLVAFVGIPALLCAKVRRCWHDWRRDG